VRLIAIAEVALSFWNIRERRRPSGRVHSRAEPSPWQCETFRLCRKLCKQALPDRLCSFVWQSSH